MTTNKQNILGSSNKLPSQYVSYSSSDAKSTLDSMNTTLSSKADSSSLSSYAPLNAPTFTGTVSGTTKAMIGLGNCDNTSDTSKPVSTAQQTAAPVFTNYIQTPRNCFILHIILIKHFDI